MDAYIARGGISHVLSQARASLKNPSRPYTPQSSARPLFHGDDYRPESRPSSAFTAAELQQMSQQQKIEPVVSSPTESTPRLNKPKAQLSMTMYSSQEKTSNKISSFTTLKLVQAPILSDSESDEELSAADMVNNDLVTTQYNPETSLTLPSNDELLQLYDEIKCSILLVSRAGLSDSRNGMAQLRELVDNFVNLSSFLLADCKLPSKQYSHDTAAEKLQAQLFNELSSVVLKNEWSSDASCVLELAPSLLDLYRTFRGSNDKFDRADSAQAIKLGKTLFVLSKESDNDSCFCNVRYVEAILNAIAETSDRSPEQQIIKGNTKGIILSDDSLSIPMKALIYTAGTLKNVSNTDNRMTNLLAANRAIAICSKTMLWRAEDAAKHTEIAQFLVQMTGILRNLSVSKNNHKQFVEAHIALRLCDMIPTFMDHQELMVNISRILSKLTLHELPRAQINQDFTNVQNLMSLIDYRQNSWLSRFDQQDSDQRFQDLMFVRVLFILGNLCAGNEQNRRLIATTFSGITLLLEVMQVYSARYTRSPLDCELNDQVPERKKSTEVLIKLIRVLANLAINADVGAQLKTEERLGSLLRILQVAQSVGDEELMLNAVSCITNVSYYSTGEAKNLNGALKHTYCFIESNRITIAQALTPLLFDQNDEVVIETARAFGNLSRFRDVLVNMIQHKALDSFVVLLDHSNREVVYTVCGVLINAALDLRTRQALLSVRPIVDSDEVDVRNLLVGIIQSAVMDDLAMVLIASKALYNLLFHTDVMPGTGRGGDKFMSDAIKMRSTLNELLDTISKYQRDRNRYPEDKKQNAPDTWDTWQQLDVVLSQLLRCLNFYTNTQ